MSRIRLIDSHYSW